MPRSVGSILSFRSPRWLRKLSCLLLLAGASVVPLAAPFGFSQGRTFVPALHPAARLTATIAEGHSGHSATPPRSKWRRRAGSGHLGADGENRPNERICKRSAAAAALGVLALTSRAAVTHAARATAEAAAPPPLVLPAVSKLAIMCLVPTLLGFYKSEYGVSYGYGTAIAGSSYLVLSSVADAAGLPLFPAIGESLSFASFRAPGILTALSATIGNLRSLLPSSLPAFHAFALFFYGTRLDFFLLYRELFLPRFRAMRERIEERAKKQGGRLKRTPFLISCAFLYFCIISPLLITSRLCGGVGMSFGWPSSDVGVVTILEQFLQVSVIMALSGFLLGAFGDLNKSIGKALGGEDTLVDWGVFRFFRHPNYTGEVIGWVSSCIAGFLAVALKTASDCGSGGRLALWKSMAPYLFLSVLGATGISFVLATATAGLEYRQKEKYGDTERYREWKKKSWVGFVMGPKEEKDAGDSPNTQNAAGDGDKSEG